MTKHVKLAKADNICLSNTSVEDLSSVIPEILKDKPNHTKIVIHTSSFDILHKKTGTETLKKHFIKLLNTLTEHQDVSISGPIACYRRGKVLGSVEKVGPNCRLQKEATGLETKNELYLQS